MPNETKLRPYFSSKRQVATFEDCLRLHRIDELNFRTLSKPLEPTGSGNGAFGGFTFAAAAWAASQTVPDGMILHSSSGNFILGGSTLEPFNIKVEKTSDGRSFCVRTVTVEQSRGVCFMCICSFKKAEQSSIDKQVSCGLDDQYSTVLAGKTPFDHPEPPDLDTPWFVEEFLPKNPDHFNPIPGIHFRKVDMTAFNKDKTPVEKKQLMYYSLRGLVPEGARNLTSKEANWHAIVHLYATDACSLTVTARKLGVINDVQRIASLSHNVILHVGIDKLMVADEPRGSPAGSSPTEPPPGEDWTGQPDEARRKWFMTEVSLNRAAEGRVMVTNKVIDPKTGVHLATSTQDALMRCAPTAKVRL